MKTRARHLALAVLAAGAFFTAGCGATVYDAQSVPKLACTPEKPLSCGFTCLPASAEADVQCGASCLDCEGANRQSVDTAATNFCNRNDPDLTLHACDFECDQVQGLHKNVLTNRCDCSDSLQVRCNGAGTCRAQTLKACGDGCFDCSDTTLFPAHAHGIPKCDDVNRVCGFDCANTFVKSPAGDACVCRPTEVACGSGGTTCVPQTPAACGSSCTNCQISFPISAAATAAGASAPLCGGDGNGADATTPCNYSCPASLPVKFFNAAAGQWDCQAGPVCDPATQHACSDNICYLNSDPTHCGSTCVTCGVAGLPTGTTATCVNSACSFDCPAGWLKSGGACVQIHTGPGTVALGATHTCIVTTAGGIMCWGANDKGQLGLASPADQLKPLDVLLSLGGVPSFIAAGTTRTCVIVGNPGQVKCWGDGSPTPANVTGLTTATVLAVGAGHSCAILADKTVRCWGANDRGQLGNGTTTPAAGLVSPTGLVNVLEISTQGDHTCARIQPPLPPAEQDNVFCWGANDLAQSGKPPSLLPVSTPSPIRGLNASQISAGVSHSCAVGTFSAGPGGPLPGGWCWGDDSLEQLGNKLQLAPTPVPQLSLLTAGKGGPAGISAGRAHTCDSKLVDGAVLCGGANLASQTGQPASDFFPQGPDISNLGAIDVLLSGGDRTCVTVVDVTVGAVGDFLLCWGANEHGQLGIGSTAVGVPVGPGLGPVKPAPQ